MIRKDEIKDKSGVTEVLVPLNLLEVDEALLEATQVKTSYKETFSYCI